MAVPVVTALDVTAGPAGTMVTITGTDFLIDCSRIQVGSYEVGLNYTFISDTNISFVVPAGTGGPHIVKVTTSGGTNSTGAAWTYATYKGGTGNPPTVTAMSLHTSARTDGAGGDTVTITGTDFMTATEVLFGTTDAVFSITSDTTIVAISPIGAGTVNVFVSNPYGTSADSANNDFVYPGSTVATLTSISPASGFPGDTVILTGTDFLETTEVLWGTLSAGFYIDSSTSMRVVVPGEATFVGTTVNVYVVNQWGTSADNRTFTYGTTTVKNLKTAVSLSSGSVAESPYKNWITTAGTIAVTLSPTYSGMPSGSVDATWYRLDNGADQKYSSAFTIAATTTAASHKVEFWSVGKDGYVEPTNVVYVNMVASKTITVTGTPAIGAIIFRWTSLAIPGERYEVYIDGTATPTTLVATVGDTMYTHKLSAGAAGVYCRVKSIDPDGTTSAYSGATTQQTSLQNQTTDLADGAISQAKLATGLVPPAIYTGGSLPTLPDATNYPTGKILYWTNDSNLYKSLGSSWSKLIGANDVVANSITAGQIATGAITADELAADSVYAKNLVIADYENLIQNANSELALPAGLSYPVDQANAAIEFRGACTTYNRGAHGRQIIGTASTTTYVDVTRPWPVRVGAAATPEAVVEYHFVAWAKASAAVAAGYGAAVRLVALQSDGTTEVATDCHISAYNNTTTWAEISIDAQVTQTTTVFMKAQLVCRSDASARTAYFDDMLCRRKLAGNLLVEGTVTADAIAGNMITGLTVRAGVLEEWPYTGGGGTTPVWHIDADGSIHGATIDSASFITGATIQTAGSGLRVSLSGGAAGYLNLYTGNTSELANSAIYVADGGSSLITRWKGPRFNNATNGDPAASYIDQTSSDSQQTITLLANHTDNSAAYIQISGQDKHVYLTGNSAALEVGDSASHVQITGSLAISVDVGVTGTLWAASVNSAGGTVAIGCFCTAVFFNPSADFSTYQSYDGVYIQDRATVAYRWKLYYDNGTDRLYVSLKGGNETHYVAFT